MRVYEVAPRTRADGGLGEVWNNLPVVYKRQGRKDDAEHAVRRAERAGFQVDRRLKDEIAGLRR